jgi:endoglucanase
MRGCIPGTVVHSDRGSAVPSPLDPTPTHPSFATSGTGVGRRARRITAVLAAVGIAVAILSSHSSSRPAAALGPDPTARIVDGRLVTGAGRPVRLLGVDVTGTESACIPGRQLIGATFNEAEADAIHSWHVDAVRVPLNEDCWLGINGVTAQMPATAYRALITRWVRALHRAGIVAILDLHWSAPGGYVADREWPMADADHSITFWSQVAATFASSRGVVFDLFNEPTLGDPSPNSGNWRCWLRGCETTASPPADGLTTPIRYRTAGMQQLLDAVRDAGAHQPILVAGLNYANDPCTRWIGGIVGSRCAALAPLPTDPDHELGLSFHVYDFNRCRTSSCWSSIDRLTTAARIPMVTTEFGEDDCRDDFMRAYMRWADAHDVSYLAWTWAVNLHPVCVPGFAGQGADLSLLQNWNGTPSKVSPEAEPLRAHLAAELR